MVYCCITRHKHLFFFIYNVVYMQSVAVSIFVWYQIIIHHIWGDWFLWNKNIFSVAKKKLQKYVKIVAKCYLSTIDLPIANEIVHCCANMYIHLFLFPFKQMNIYSVAIKQYIRWNVCVFWSSFAYIMVYASI